MKTLSLLLFLLSATLLYAYEDSDMDGVEDAFDKCPGTPFSDLVNESGCSIESLISPHHFDIITGLVFSDSDYKTLSKTDTFSTTLQLDYYYKEFSLQLSSSYYTTSGDDGYSQSGANDTYIGMAYQIKRVKNLSLSLGGGLFLPTYVTSLNNNRVDYTLAFNMSYQFDAAVLFGGYSYTIINDSDTTIYYDDNTSQDINYQDTVATNLGIGYYFDEQLYASFAYNSSDSIYRSVEMIETLSVYAYYEVDEHWFTTLSYAYGLSQSASQNYLCAKLGYYF